jgi:hypothetical protein
MGSFHIVPNNTMRIDIAFGDENIIIDFNKWLHEEGVWHSSLVGVWTFYSADMPRVKEWLVTHDIVEKAE